MGVALAPGLQQAGAQAICIATVVDSPEPIFQALPTPALATSYGKAEQAHVPLIENVMWNNSKQSVFACPSFRA